MDRGDGFTIKKNVADSIKKFFIDKDRVAGLTVKQNKINQFRIQQV